MNKHVDRYNFDRIIQLDIALNDTVSASVPLVIRFGLGPQCPLLVVKSTKLGRSSRRDHGSVYNSIGQTR